MTACGIERPESTMSSSTLSNIEESEPFGLMMGVIFLMSSPNTGDWNSASRARIQLMLPRSVLISPLCAMQRYGCARSQLGKVLVEKRECTSAMADLHQRVLQVEEILVELHRGQHALVDQRLVRQR